MRGFLIFIGFLCVSISCADVPDSKRLTKILAPDEIKFENSVSPFLEKRCGTLDCHGGVGRPLRLFSGRGLRLPSGEGGAVFPGSSDTTDLERRANYRSVIGLEPELISRVEAGVAQPRDLLLLQKPLGLGDPTTEHKGGQVLAAQGDPGEECIRSWLQEGVNVTACNSAAGNF